MTSNSPSLDDPENPLAMPRAVHADANFDITAMIDLVFMMNIYFLVTTIGAAMGELNLPVAKHCIAADRETSVIVSIIEGVDRSAGQVYVGDGREGEPLVEREEQEKAVRAAVEEGLRSQKNTVLIKAEKNVRLRDVARVAAVAAAVPGMELKLAVIEKE
ncbi:MAG: biopolymer transporter ExbD [Candidatus Saccharimonas sp.]|nr:biopolymer transporter ExbD [Planctomycetaceae bacterium]